MKRLLFGWVTLVLLLGGAVQADYIYTTLDSTILGAFGTTHAFGINDSGQVVGRDNEAVNKISSRPGGFLFDGKNIWTTIFVPPGLPPWPTGINNAGQIVGYYPSGASTPYSGFLLNQGAYTTFTVPGAASTQARGINILGQIVGNSSLGAFLLSGGNYTMLNVPGSTGTLAFGINDLGHIVGTSSAGAFLLSGGNYTMLTLPGYPTGINDRDQIVGNLGGGGFLFSDGNYTQVDFPGSTSSFAEEINDFGDIVGYYTDSVGFVHGFIAAPVVSEPAALGLLGVGMLGMIGYCLRRSRRG